MSNPYQNYAQAAVTTLNNNWFGPTTPSHWVPNDYWRTPTICQELVFYMLLAGNSDYVPTLENARQIGEGWLNTCAYLDDLTCWGRFFISAYNFLNTGGGQGADPSNYLNDAMIACSNLAAGYDTTCGGGVPWQRYPSGNNFKAANSTLGYMEIALGLYNATQQQSYLQAAQTAFAWLQQTGLLATNGMVWGGLTPSPGCQVDPKNPPVIALQGNPLAPLWLLYAATGDTQCLDIAQTICSATMANMVWPGTQILQAAPDAQWNNSSQPWKEQYSTPTMFKGVFAGFLGNFAASLATVSDPARQQAASQYAAILAANADALWANFPNGIFGMDWHTPSPNYQPDSDSVINASLQYSALAAFVGAAQNS